MQSQDADLRIGINRLGHGDSIHISKLSIAYSVDLSKIMTTHLSHINDL